ncbi:hypothetical protein MLD38_025122 [Melastoma candidum]|uniref:Uncharacterized protein n=1 Tax=Melastoma candidum TaxID=119954 RepID=A0ACB9NVC8_9MYRT|nr:hypothetical protein MLD38_025122 [Melastoma candidum]
MAREIRACFLRLNYVWAGNKALESSRCGVQLGEESSNFTNEEVKTQKGEDAPGFVVWSAPGEMKRVSTASKLGGTWVVPDLGVFWEGEPSLDMEGAEHGWAGEGDPPWDSGFAGVPRRLGWVRKSQNCLEVPDPRLGTSRSGGALAAGRGSHHVGGSRDDRLDLVVARRGGDGLAGSCEGAEAHRRAGLARETSGAPSWVDLRELPRPWADPASLLPEIWAGSLSEGVAICCRRSLGRFCGECRRRKGLAASLGRIWRVEAGWGDWLFCGCWVEPRTGLPWVLGAGERKEAGRCGSQGRHGRRASGSTRECRGAALAASAGCAGLRWWRQWTWHVRADSGEDRLLLKNKDDGGIAWVCHWKSEKRQPLSKLAHCYRRLIQGCRRRRIPSWLECSRHIHSRKDRWRLLQKWLLGRKRGTDQGFIWIVIIACSRCCCLERRRSWIEATRSSRPPQQTLETVFVVIAKSPSKAVGVFGDEGSWRIAGEILWRLSGDRAADGPGCSVETEAREEYDFSVLMELSTKLEEDFCPRSIIAAHFAIVRDSGIFLLLRILRSGGWVIEEMSRADTETSTFPDDSIPLQTLVQCFGYLNAAMQNETVLLHSGFGQLLPSTTAAAECLFVKISMDDAPHLRKRQAIVFPTIV